MSKRQFAWVLGGLLLGAITWIVLRVMAYSEGHSHTVVTSSAFVLFGGLLGWIVAKILRVK
jgi:hypothetical protein